MFTWPTIYQRTLFSRAHFNYVRPVLVIFAWSLLFVSCKKGDEEPPQVQINSPTENSVYQFDDFITVEVSGSDNRSVESVSVSIRNEAGLQVLRSQIKTFSNQTSFSESFFLSYDNLHLDDGEYFIYAEVYDGDLVSTAFRSIRLTPVPKVLQSIHVLVSDNNQRRIETFALNGSPLLTYSLSGAFDRFHINSYDQKIYAIGSSLDGIHTYSAGDYSLEQTIDIPFDLGPQLFVHSAWDSARRELFVTSNNPFIYRINALGMEGQHFASPRSLHVGVQSDYVVSFSIQNLTQRRLETYRKSTGFFIQSLSIPDSVVFLAPANTANRMVYLANKPFEDDNTRGVLKVFDIEAHYLDEWTPLFLNASTTKILDAELTGDGVAVAQIDGLRVYRFDGSRVEGGSYTPVDMHYESISDILLVLESNRLVLLRASDLSELSSIAISGGLAVQTLYNK